jgi:hypothetical protein
MLTRAPDAGQSSPTPRALVDGPQARLWREWPLFIDAVTIAREAYDKRIARPARTALSTDIDLTCPVVVMTIAARLAWSDWL